MNGNNIRREIRFEALVQQNQVFGFEHLQPNDRPRMAERPRGIALYLQSISGFSIPRQILANFDTKSYDLGINVNLSMYHANSKTFFGSTWTSDCIIIKNIGKDKLSLDIESVIYTLTRIVDSTCVCIAEVVLSVIDSKGVTVSQYGVGWSILSVFGNVDGDAALGFAKFVKKTSVLNGSPRDLLTMDKLTISPTNDVVLNFAVCRYDQLPNISQLVPENLLLDSDDVIPGLLPKPIITLDGKEALVSCIGVNEIINNEGVNKVAGTIDLFETIDLTLTEAKLFVHNRRKVEELIINEVLSQGQRANDNKIPAQNKSATMRYANQAISLNRSLKIGVHNGLKLVNHDYECFQCSVDDTDEDCLNLPDCFVRGFVADNENVAVIFSLEYDVIPTSRDESNFLDVEQSTRRIIIGSSVFFPPSRIAREVDSKNDDKSGHYSLDMIKIGYAMELGITGDYLYDVLVGSKFELDTSLESCILSFKLSKINDNTSIGTGLIRKKERPDHDVNILTKDQSELFNDRESLISVASDFRDSIDSRRREREREFPTQIEDDRSFEQSLVESMYQTNERRPIPENDMRKSRLLDASLELNITMNNRAAPHAKSSGYRYNDNNSALSLNNKFQSTGVDSFSQAIIPMPTLSKSSPAQGVFDVAGMDINAEIDDSLLISEVSIQFLGIRFNESKQDTPTSIFCTFHFYNFRPVKTEVYKIVQSSTPLCILRRFEDGATNDPPLAIRFVVDRSLSISSNYRFLDYLADSFFMVDIWDADSLVLIGSSLVPLHSILRQGRPYVVSSKEYEFKEFDVNETKIAVSESRPAIGDVGGFIQLSISHYGKPNDSTPNDSRFVVKSSSNSSINPAEAKSSNYRPKVSVRAGVLSHEIFDTAEPKDYSHLKENDVTYDDLQILFKRFPGDKKGFLKYEGKFLSLIGIASARRLYQRLLVALCKYEDDILEKELRKYADSENVITANNVEEFVARLSSKFALCFSKPEIRDLSMFILDNRSASDCRVVFSKLLNDSIVIGTETIRLKLIRAFEVLSLKGQNVHDILGSFASNNLTLAELTSAFKRLEQNSIIESSDTRLLIRFFTKSRSYLSANTISINDVTSFLGLQDYQSIKETLEINILKDLSSCKNILDQHGVGVFTDVAVSNIIKWMEQLFPVICSENKQSIMRLLSSSSKNECISWFKFARSISSDKRLVILGDPKFFLKSLCRQAESKGIDVYEIMGVSDANSDGRVDFDEISELFSTFDFNCDLSLVETAVELFLESIETEPKRPLTLSDIVRHIGIGEYKIKLEQKIAKVFAVACDKGLSLESIFSELDKDKSGQITIEEFFQGLSALGTFPGVSASDIRLMIGGDVLSLNRFIECFEGNVREVIERKSYTMLARKLAKCRIRLRRDNSATDELKALITTSDDNNAKEKFRLFLMKISVDERDANDIIELTNKEGMGNSIQERISNTFLGRHDTSARRDLSLDQQDVPKTETAIPKYLSSSSLICSIQLEHQVSEAFVFSTDIEIRNVEKKFSRIMKFLMSKRLDVVGALRSSDINNTGCISRDDFLEFLSNNGVCVLSENQSSPKLVNKFNEGIERSNGRNLIENRNNLRDKREAQKRMLIQNAISNCTTSRCSIYPNFGETTMFNFEFANPFNHDERFIISFDDPSLRLVSSEEEMAYCRSLGRFSSLPFSKFDPSAYDIDHHGNCNATALPSEKINLFFAYYAIDGNMLKQGSSKAIEIKISSVSYGYYIAVVKLDINLQSYVVHRSMHFYEPELSTTKKNMLFIPRNSNSSRRKYVHCFEPGSETNEMKPRGLVDWKSDKNRISIDFMYKCSKFPQNGQVLIFLYDDQFRLKLCEVWLVVVSTCQRIDSNCTLGSVSCMHLFISGDSYHRRVKAYSYGSAITNFVPSKIFGLEPNNYHKIQLKASYLQLGKRKLLVNLVDIDSHELISSWIISVVVTAPEVKMKSFTIDFQASETAHKRLRFKNVWGIDKRYQIISSDERFLTSREKNLHMSPLSTSELRLSFTRNVDEAAMGYLLIVDDDGHCEDCYLFQSLS